MKPMIMALSRGFSLVEIAIVLVVVGLLVSGGLKGATALKGDGERVASNKRMDAIQGAIQVYVIQNGCLPCPSKRNLSTDVGATTPYGPDGRSYDGTAAGSPYTTGCGAGNACTATQGIVPWISLGMSRDDVIDGWGNFIDFVVSPGSTSVTCTGSAGTTPALNISSISMVRTPPSTYPCGTLVVSDAANNVQISAAAYVLISHGLDGSGGYLLNGKQKPDPNNGALQTQNTAGSNGPCTAASSCVADKPQGTSSSSGYFDDIVRFVTAPVVIQSCGSNACGNPA